MSPTRITEAKRMTTLAAEDAVRLSAAYARLQSYRASNGEPCIIEVLIRDVLIHAGDPKYLQQG